MHKTLLAGAAAAAALTMQATTALACGGLVAPDGDLRLAKATTFVAWRSGVEHYITSFAYQGTAVDVGWIVPLPAVPDAIGTAGRWTLQRLEREVHPPAPELEFATAAGSAASPVVEQVQVEALDVTILKGSGAIVVNWCAHNGFALNAETRDHLLRYAQASPVFMAAKYNTSDAQHRGLAQGDGVPLQMTMRTPRLWVPLEVLANDDTAVNADLFLLTDSPLSTGANPLGWLFPRSLGPTGVGGAQGFVLAKQEPMNDALHGDLAGDRNMAWLPSTGWLSYLTLNAPSSAVTYDLTVDSTGAVALASFGSSVQTAPPSPASPLLTVLGVGAAAAVAMAAGLLTLRYRRSSLAISTVARPSSGSMRSTRQ